MFILPPAETSLKIPPLTTESTTNLLKVSLSSTTSLANLLKRYLISDTTYANLLKVADGSIPELVEFAEKLVAIDKKFSEDAWFEVELDAILSEIA